MRQIRSGLVGVAIIGFLVGTIPITAFAGARAYRRRTLGLHFGCLSIVRGFNP